jgi:uncharacterized protein (DUF1800 family)
MPAWLFAAAGVLLATAAIAAAPDRDTRPADSRPAADRHALTADDLRWLNRVTFGITSDIVARYRAAGRSRFLDEQLHPLAGDAPELAADLAAIPTTHRSARDLLLAARAEQLRINALPEDQKQAARMAANQAAAAASYDVARRHLLRALYSPTQLREEMTWFWMNHFSVYSGKGNLRWSLGEYEDHAIRPHALGKFRDLVMATVVSPAMLEYLDNAQSAANKINENYARELMELHTLGVSGGPSGSHYTQQDVQELARVLTGVGLNLTGNAPKLPPAARALYVHDGVFEFNPNRHDAGPKTILGRTLQPGGMPEVEEAITLLCRQPATARFVSAKLATYFVADEPPAKLIDAMAGTFTRTDGDIAAVLKTMFLSPAFAASLPRADQQAGKLKDPVQFVVSSLRLAYDGKPISNYRPVVSWLTQLGEPLYGRVTPDGYPLTEPAWASSGQLVKRFEIARAIGSGNAGLFNADDGTPGPRIGFPMLNNRLFYEAIDPALSARTRMVLAQTASQQEWNTVLLSSPDWMLR